MHKLAPDHVARGAVMEGSTLPDPYRHRLLDLCHGLAHRFLKRTTHPLIAAKFVGKGYRFWCVECEIVGTATIRFHACGELLAGFRVLVVAQPVKRLLVDRSSKAECLSPKAMPLARNLLAILHVVVGLCQLLFEVVLCRLAVRRVVYE